MTLPEDVAVLLAGFSMGVAVAGWLAPELRLVLFVVAIVVAALAFVASRQ